MRNLEQDAGTVAGLSISTLGTTVTKILKNLQRVVD